VRLGKVYLVGAGPGDPGLITVKGLDCLRGANVVIYDRLVNESLLNETRPGTERIYVGKEANRHTWTQEAINGLLLKKAREGKVVVRLKGGDPFVFGRGGEEAEVLAMNRIPFEVVPGVSSAVAVPAYAGIPVTDRRFASSFTVITGHKAHDKDTSSISWHELRSGPDTLVILMGMANLAKVIEELLESNRPPSTPVAVISNGTSHRQRCITGTLRDIIARVESEGIDPPAVVVVGEVARLREHLCWFDNRPLFGKRIMIIGALQQTVQLGQLLRGCGAVVVELPVLEIELAPTPSELDQAILNLKDYHWLIFTSISSVDAFFERLYALNQDARGLVHLRVGVIGPTTARALEERGLRADYIPPKYTIKGFLAGLKRQDMAGCRVLLPRSDTAGKKLAAGLARLGAEVHEVVAYRTILNAEAVSEGKEMLLSGEIDLVTFTNSSIVTNVVGTLDKDRGAINKRLVACIGPKTATAASKAGLRVDIVAHRHTIPGLVEAMEEYFQKGEKESNGAK
jgi:uroporphyrinogen III methyltransferase/synthase